MNEILELILSALKTKFEGVSDNVLSRIANKLAKTAANSYVVFTIKKCARNLHGKFPIYHHLTPNFTQTEPFVHSEK